MNAGIPPEWCHLGLASVDETVHHIIRMGQQSLLAKVDIEKHTSTPAGQMAAGIDVEGEPLC